MRSLILVFCLFGLALSAPQYFSNELDDSQQQQQQQQQQQDQLQQQQLQRENVRVAVEKAREEAIRRRVSERLGQRVESEDATPRREALVILRPTVAQAEPEVYDGQQEQDQSAVPGDLRQHHTRSHKLAARFAVVRVIPVQVQEQPQQEQQQQQQQQQQQEQQQSGQGAETTTEEPETTTTEEPSTTTEAESTTSSSEEPSNEQQQQQQPAFTSDAAAVLNSKTVTTFQARKKVNGKQVTVLGRTMALRSSFMNVLRPLIPRRAESDDDERKNETDEQRRERERAEQAAKNTKIVEFTQMQAIKSTKSVITQDVPTF